MHKISFCEIWSLYVRLFKESLFSRAPIRTISFIQLQVSFIALEKCEKESNMFEIILVRGFCPLKIKITQSSNGFYKLKFFP